MTTTITSIICPSCEDEDAEILGTISEVDLSGMFWRNGQLDYNRLGWSGGIDCECTQCGCEFDIYSTRP